MKHCRSYLLCVVLLTFARAVLLGQSPIRCDIVELAELTFESNPIIKEGFYNIKNAEAGLQLQISEFDYRLISEISYQNIKKNTLDNDPLNNYISGEYFKTRNTDYTLGVQKKFRTGHHANLSIRYSLDNNNNILNSFNEEVGSYIAENSSSATLSITQPLLSGRGMKTTTALENSAIKNVESLKRDYRFSVEREIYQLGAAYWQYLNSYKSLEIYQKNENRVKEILKVTEELVKADKKPSGELAQIYAELADQERQTKLAEQDLINARIDLGKVIGLSTENSQKLNIPLNSFPTVSESGYQDVLTGGVFIELAKSNRDDIKSIQKRIESLELQMYSAKRNLKPQLDLTGTLIYGGQAMGNGIDNSLPVMPENEGTSLGGGLSLSLTLPVNNNAARGNFAKIESSLTAQEIIFENLERNISLNVRLALSNLNNSVIVLHKANESLTHYRKAFENEEVKFQNGLTTLLNLLIYQARLTNAELVYLQTYQQFAIAIMKLRFETGTLVKQDQHNNYFVDYGSFYTIPTIHNL